VGGTAVAGADVGACVETAAVVGAGADGGACVGGTAVAGAGVAAGAQPLTKITNIRNIETVEKRRVFILLLLSV
jgi:hypothetical protein